MQQSTSPGPYDATRLLNAAHHNLIFNRRVRVLSERLAEMLPEQGMVLDLP